MFKVASIILCGALLLLTGCVTAPHDNSDAVATDWSATKPVVTPPKVAPPAKPTLVKPVKLPVARTNVPPPKIITRPAPILTWTSLNRWAAENKLAPPRKVASSPVTSYAISSASGKMILTIGSQEAIWRGMEIHLGFAPEIIDDQIFVHGVDLQTSIEPLLLGSPLTFSPDRVIVIDPGHGGKESGTKSVLGGRYEKDFTLDWARRIKLLLATNGWTVYLTRTNDTDITLSNRVAFAESHHADLFISLHFNSSAPRTQENGVETYCLTPTGMPSTLTRGYPDIWSDHYPNNNFDEQNLLLAIRLHAGILQGCGQEDRGIRHARFMGVLRGQKRPAILIEGGYLSNPREAGKIESAAFRQKLAEAVANALK